MIEVKGITKAFDDIQAIGQISATIKEGEVFGLVGTNGAGKSTFLRIISGVLRPDQGEVLIDGQFIYENQDKKQDIFLISDDPYFFPNSTPEDMICFYEIVYPSFNRKKAEEMMEKFGLVKKRKIHTFSKGMKKQLSVIFGVCAGTKYLFCDETFDGLDPVMRQAVKSVFAAEMTARDFTPVIASHNLRELEDICDHVGLLHQGGLLLSEDLDDMKMNIHKIQYVLRSLEREEELLRELSVVHRESQGSLQILTVRGAKEEILQKIEEKDPIFYEILPLSLEEIFINETEVAGYDIKNIIS